MERIFTNSLKKQLKRHIKGDLTVHDDDLQEEETILFNHLR